MSALLRFADLRRKSLPSQGCAMNGLRALVCEDLYYGSAVPSALRPGQRQDPRDAVIYGAGAFCPGDPSVQWKQLA